MHELLGEIWWPVVAWNVAVTWMLQSLSSSDVKRVGEKLDDFAAISCFLMTCVGRILICSIVYLTVIKSVLGKFTCVYFLLVCF